MLYLTYGACETVPYSRPIVVLEKFAKTGLYALLVEFRDLIFNFSTSFDHA